jgi:predicted phosphate transport protein (TIGR00153 family)
MRTILSLFGHSPFAPLQAHMDSVSLCVHKLYDLVDAIEQKDYARQELLGEEISALEHKADLIKNGIRNHLPKSLFLPIDHSSLLEILSIQDRIADKSQDVAVMVSLKKMVLLSDFKDEFKLFLKKNVETFDEARVIVKELHELVESSFGGIEAEAVRKLIEGVGVREHEVDIIQRQLLKALFKAEDQMNYVTFHQWMRLFECIGAISNLSENLANRVRMTLELK